MPFKDVNYALITQGLNWGLRTAVMVISGGEIFGFHILASDQWLVLLIFMLIFDAADIPAVVFFAKEHSPDRTATSGLSAFRSMYRLLIFRWAVDLLLGIFLLVFFLDLGPQGIDRNALTSSPAIRNGLQWYLTMGIPVYLWPIDLCLFFDSIILTIRTLDGGGLKGKHSSAGKAKLLPGSTERY